MVTVQILAYQAGGPDQLEYSVGTPYSETVTIVDDDDISLPSVTIAADVATVDEGIADGAPFTLTAYGGTGYW